MLHSYLYVTYQKRHSNSVSEQEWLNAKWAIFHPYHGENKLYFKDICFKLDQHAQLDFYSDSSDTTVPGLTTHWLDFSLSWLKGDVRENLGDFRKSIQILTFLFPLSHVPLPFTKTNVLHNNLKKDAINDFGIKYWTLNHVRVTFQEHGSSFYVNIEEKVWLLVKKIRTWKDWQGDFFALVSMKSPNFCQKAKFQSPLSVFSSPYFFHQ